MYKIIKAADGSVLASTDKPVFVRNQENGCFGLCEEEEADGVCVGGTVYDLPAGAVISGAEDVFLQEADGAAEQAAIQEQVRELGEAMELLLSGATE